MEGFILLLFSLIILSIGLVYTFMVEDATWGPSGSLGYLVIDSWEKWWALLVVACLYNVLRSIVHEYIGRKLHRTEEKKKELPWSTILFLSMFNIYEWICHALTLFLFLDRRVVIFLVTILVDTVAKAVLWSVRGGVGTGRRPRL